jgi:hypothetical protein
MIDLLCAVCVYDPSHVAHIPEANFDVAIKYLSEDVVFWEVCVH